MNTTNFEKIADKRDHIRFQLELIKEKIIRTHLLQEDINMNISRHRHCMRTLQGVNLDIMNSL